MDETEHSVAIVVDRAFGSRLTDLARRLHVWIVDSPINRPARDRVWEASPEYVLESGATRFRDHETQSPDEVAAGILGDVERHHGYDAHTPPVSRLEIYGARCTAPLRTALEDLGYDGFDDASDGFVALRLVEDSGGGASLDPSEDLVPTDKSDLARAEAAVKAGYPAVAPILGQLVEWLQDCNWPVAGVLAPFLQTVGAPLVPRIWHVLRGDDDVWKYWVIGEPILVLHQGVWSEGRLKLYGSGRVPLFNPVVALTSARRSIPLTTQLRARVQSR